MGYDVTVAHCYLKGTFLSSIWSRKTEIADDLYEGIRTIRIGVSPVFIGLKQFAYMKLTEQAQTYLNKIFKETKQPDIIHSHSIFNGRSCRIALIKSVEYALDTHGTFFRVNFLNQMNIQKLI